MSDSYRLFVELPGGAKFRAQGDVAQVRVDLERFFALLNSPQTSTAKSDPNGAAVDDGDTSTNGDTPPDDVGRVRSLDGGLDSALLSRLFAKDSNGTVSLRALPRGDKAEADALVALIYGASKLGNEHQVTGSRLMKAATQSGLHQVDRIDRSLSTEIGQHVTIAGYKRGRRYGLTNPGIRRAEEVLKGILG